MKLLILLLVIAVTVQADEPAREPYWYEDENNFMKPYILTITDEADPHLYELPDDYPTRELCVEHALKIFVISKGRTYTGFICERGRAEQ